ncbi:MAG TPA: GNAT family N-acetyltransferase [Firmicutes bacterium]|nr:GNAT family N-acetyltransferase [Bacillota bacterium]
MKIVDLSTQTPAIKEQAAILLVENFDKPTGWPNMESARKEVEQVLCDGFALAMVAEEKLLGWIGGLPEYDGRVWELHPLVVHREHRRQGIGRQLVAAFEVEAARRGALTVTVSTDDDSGWTSLSGVDLYQDLPRQIAEIRDLGYEHPFLFYQKLGFVITGVMPDANGPGLPDIYMSKSTRAISRDHQPAGGSQPAGDLQPTGERQPPEDCQLSPAVEKDILGGLAAFQEEVGRLKGAGGG